MSDDPPLALKIDGVVHAVSREYDIITQCGIQTTTPDWKSQFVLEPVGCAMCLAEEEIEPVFRCKCSWVGGDPDIHRGKPTCPACWHHDKKRVVVTAT